MRTLIFPSDPTVRAVFAGGLREGRSKLDQKRAARAYKLRLDRAQATGVLPARVYVSPRRFGWYADEFEEAIAKLPRSYAPTKTAAA